MHPHDRRCQIQGRDRFRDGARGLGSGTSNSNLASGDGGFLQALPWDGVLQFQG